MCCRLTVTPVDNAIACSVLAIGQFIAQDAQHEQERKEKSFHYWLPQTMRISAPSSRINHTRSRKFRCLNLQTYSLPPEKESLHVNMKCLQDPVLMLDPRMEIAPHMDSSPATLLPVAQREKVRFRSKKHPESPSFPKTNHMVSRNESRLRNTRRMERSHLVSLDSKSSETNPVPMLRRIFLL